MPNYALTRIPSAQAPVIDPTTGLMSREWFRFFNALFEQLGGGTAQATGTFTTVDSKTVTVVNGIISRIV
jgi:hypothetical protein